MNNIEEIKAALHTAAQMSDKLCQPKTVWDLANKALRMAEKVSPELWAVIDTALEKGCRHYPNISAAFVAIDQYQHQQKLTQAVMLRERLRLQCDAWAEVIIGINDTNAPDRIKVPMLAIAEAKLTEVQTEMRNLKTTQP